MEFENMNGDVVQRNPNQTATGKLAQANDLMSRAEKNTKRRWNNGWKRPKLLKAGNYYTNAAKLFCQDINSGKKIMQFLYILLQPRVIS